MALREGQKVTALSDNEDPSTSTHTDLVAAALSVGIPFASDKAYRHTVEMVDGKPRRTVTWLMDGDAEAEFDLPDGGKESLTFQELRERALDDKWMEDNNRHPWAYAWIPLKQKNSLMGMIKTTKPMALIRKGKSFITIPADSPEAKRTELLQLL